MLCIVPLQGEAGNHACAPVALRMPVHPYAYRIEALQWALIVAIDAISFFLTKNSDKLRVV